MYVVVSVTPQGRCLKYLYELYILRTIHVYMRDRSYRSTLLLLQTLKAIVWKYLKQMSTIFDITIMYELSALC